MAFQKRLRQVKELGCIPGWNANDLWNWYREGPNAVPMKLSAIGTF